MLEMIKLQGMLFLLLGIGVIARKRNIITEQGRKSLSNLVIHIILPCNIINSFRIERAMSILQQCGLVLAVAFVAQLFYLILSKCVFYGFPHNQKVVLQYATICSNAGFMGNPVVEAVYGAQGLLYASVALIPLRIAMWSAGLSLFTSTDRKNVVKKLIVHPCMIAVYIGFVLMFSQAELPAFLSNTLKSVGGCNTAVSMIVIGAILAEIDVKLIINPKLFYYSLWRLILIPCMVFGALSLFHVDALVTGVTVLLAAMPAGSTTAMLADTYGADSAFASACVFVSTVLSIITLPLISMLL